MKGGGENSKVGVGSNGAGRLYDVVQKKIGLG